MLEPDLEEFMYGFAAGVSPALPENFRRAQGRLAISTELSAANTHSVVSLPPRGSAGISVELSLPRWSRIAPLSKIEMSPSVSQGTWPNGWCAKWAGFRSPNGTLATR
jgi:hypothetical protein